MGATPSQVVNVAVERFFLTLKYEEVYLKKYKSVQKLRAGIARFMEFYNFNRFHPSLEYRKPMEVYRLPLKKAA